MLVKFFDLVVFRKFICCINRLANNFLNFVIFWNKCPDLFKQLNRVIEYRLKLQILILVVYSTKQQMQHKMCQFYPKYLFFISSETSGNSLADVWHVLHRSVCGDCHIHNHINMYIVLAWLLLFFSGEFWSCLTSISKCKFLCN